jgi:sortase A
MTTTVDAPAPSRQVPRSARILRWVGWTLITAGCVVLLYLVYSLFFTNLETNAAQADLREQWERSLAAEEPVEQLPGEAEEPADTDEPAEPDAEPEPDPVDIGGARALIEFHRPGSDTPPVLEDPVFVVEGVTVQALKAGPGHYPGTALPGEDGNFAVAGHRTTYGAPFFHLDDLVAGDEIHVTDRQGRQHVYEVRETAVVTPGDTWVIEPDPLESGAPTMTLTTCHPRFSAAQRLVVFAELAS